MIGRRQFGMAGLSAAALAAMHSTGLAGEKDHEHELHDECAEACSDCQRECDACATHCAGMVADGKKNHIMSMQSCQDCADFCAAASRIVARGGLFSTLICESCAEACARCAKQCEEHPHDKRMTACAKECRKCETACRGMIKVA